MGTGPMYCPYGGGLCQHAAIERCGMQLSNLIECKVFWEREHASEQFDIGPPKPTSPPEMPKGEQVIGYIHEIDYPRMEKVLRKYEGKSFSIIINPTDDPGPEEGEA